MTEKEQEEILKKLQNANLRKLKKRYKSKKKLMNLLKS